MIDLSNEHVLSLCEACRLIPPARGGRHCHISTPLRWITRGVVTTDGRRVRLRASRLGARWLTSREAIADFMAALTPQSEMSDQSQAPRTPGKRLREAERAAERLEALGI
jgi:hypothetical protein